MTVASQHNGRFPFVGVVGRLDKLDADFLVLGAGEGERGMAMLDVVVVVVVAAITATGDILVFPQSF